MTSVHFFLLLIIFPYSEAGHVGRGLRATRMSVVEFWKNETRGDGLNVRVAHGVNSWPDLVEQLHEPFLNKSMMIEGDVFLQAHRRPRHRAIPVMRADTRMADRITFKEWLGEVASMHKAIKINLRSTEVVRPVLHYLYASQADPTAIGLQYPLILHANVFRSPRSLENAVDADTFVEKTRALFPDATLSLGFTKQANFSHLHPRFKKLTWRQLFHLLEFVSRLDQPIMLSVRLTVASNSKKQLLWLLGLASPVSLLIWSDKEDTNVDWESMSFVRRHVTRNRVLYDLLPEHRLIMQNITDNTPEDEPEEFFSLSNWHAVEFASSSNIFSSIVRSSRGPAFLGFPSALLISQKPPPQFPNKQTVSGIVHFLPKALSPDIEVEDRSGLLISLLDQVHELESPQINKAIQLFVGFDGRVTLENSATSLPYYDTKSVTQLPKSDCYAFKVTDEGWHVSAEVWVSNCADKAKKVRRAVAKVDLDTPFQKTQSLRNVVVSKVGDGAVDFILPVLQHSRANILSYLFVFIISIFRLL